MISSSECCRNGGGNCDEFFLSIVTLWSVGWPWLMDVSFRSSSLMSARSLIIVGFAPALGFKL